MPAAAPAADYCACYRLPAYGHSATCRTRLPTPRRERRTRTAVRLHAPRGTGFVSFAVPAADGPAPRTARGSTPHSIPPVTASPFTVLPRSLPPTVSTCRSGADILVTTVLHLYLPAAAYCLPDALHYRSAWFCSCVGFHLVYHLPFCLPATRSACRSLRILNLLPAVCLRFAPFCLPAAA